MQGRERATSEKSESKTRSNQARKPSVWTEVMEGADKEARLWMMRAGRLFQIIILGFSFSSSDVLAVLFWVSMATLAVVCLWGQKCFQLWLIMGGPGRAGPGMHTTPPLAPMSHCCVLQDGGCRGFPKLNTERAASDRRNDFLCIWVTFQS